MRTRVGFVLLIALASASCAAPLNGPLNGPFTLSIPSGVHPSRSADEVVAISRAYLDEQTPELAAPGLHTPPKITAVWAMRAADAASLDGCIPPGQADRLVWITKGQGDYLNLRDHTWSKSTNQADATDPRGSSCEGPGPQGTIVIDDTTGEILGVYPESPGYPHPPP